MLSLKTEASALVTASLPAQIALGFTTFYTKLSPSFF